MSLKSFTQDKTTFDEVFNYLKNYVDTYALRQIYAGQDTSGIKNALEIIKLAERSLLSENNEPKKPVKDRAL